MKLNWYYTVHYSIENEISAISGEYYSINQFNVVPSLNESECFSKALKEINSIEYAWDNSEMEGFLKEITHNPSNTFFPSGELVVLPDRNSVDFSNCFLAFKFKVTSSNPFASEIVYVDATNGNIIDRYSTFADVLVPACTEYSGSTQQIETSFSITENALILEDNIRGGGIKTKNVVGPNFNNITCPTCTAEVKDINNNYACIDFNIGQKNAALDVHWGGMMTYDYFSQVHNRNSYDNLGAPLNFFVHYRNFSGGIAATNLGVLGMAFGDGGTDQFGNVQGPLTTIDIVAHEFAHGLSESTSNLSLNGESGAINEGLSDIWGAVVENWVVKDPSDTDKDTWLLGEENRLVGKIAERSMRDPNLFNDPDTYLGTSWDFSLNATHSNSGVLNHWFYLLSDGGSETNSFGYTFSLTGIGIQKAADIVYYMETVYLTSNINYFDIRQMTIHAAKDLYGECSLEVKGVVDAWDAVGVMQPQPQLVFGCGTNGSGIYDINTANFVIADGILPAGVIYSDESFCGVPITVLSGARAIFKASNKIFIGAGFKAERGSNFKAYIFECVGGGNYRMQQPNGNQPEEENEMMRMITKNPISIYPNPNTGEFTIKLEKPDNNLIEIYDVMGKKIFSKIVFDSKTVIDVSNQPKGIYLVKVLNGNSVITKKIIYQ